MYLNYFGMTNTPFVRNLPVDQLYTSPAIENSLALLKFAVDNQKFVVLTGDAGCGKTTVIRQFQAGLNNQAYIVLYVTDSKLTPCWLYRNMLEQLEIQPKFYRSDVKHQLQTEIQKTLEIQKKKVVFILDEAHLLEKETLEEFRFLLNFKFDSESPMALVLVGQTELIDEKLRLKCYTAIRQRVDFFCTLPHLDRIETERYINAHLKYAGCKDELFTSKAVDIVFQQSSGIPRVINHICDHSLMLAAQEGRKTVDNLTVQRICETEYM